MDSLVGPLLSFQFPFLIRNDLPGQSDGAYLSLALQLLSNSGLSSLLSLPITTDRDGRLGLPDDGLAFLRRCISFLSFFFPTAGFPIFHPSYHDEIAVVDRDDLMERTALLILCLSSEDRSRFPLFLPSW